MSEERELEQCWKAFCKWHKKQFGAPPISIVRHYEGKDCFKLCGREWMAWQGAWKAKSALERAKE